MKQNIPVTDQEFVVGDEQYLISKTDLKGRITYCNPAFIEISGFSREELLGKAHNIVRHPDMPPEAFQDMWDTLQAGKPWLAVVKNRHKHGGYYWVLANAMPVMENGVVTGYASVRVKASTEQIRQAEAFYTQIREGRSGGYALRQGRRVPVGWRAALHALAAPLRRGVQATLLRMAVAMCALAAIPTHLAASQHPAWAWPLWAGHAGVCAAYLLATMWLARRITAPLAGAEELARQIAAGNLVNDIDPAQAGEMRNLYFYLDLMRKSLIGISSEVIGKTADHVRSIAQLRQGSESLAARTEAQSGALQETAASVEQLTATVLRNAESAQAATGLARESQALASQGGQIVDELNATMQALDGSSRKISEIVTLIEGIAFQTNILALNAAVEAARAGEQGRGFAVVAGEVRNLAHKSSAAAKEIKALIDQSVQRMSLGSGQASQAGTAMQRIMDAVRRVNDLVEEISRASAGQSGGVRQISGAVARMDGVAQQNVALVGDLHEVAQHLGHESQALVQAIAVFRTPQAGKALAGTR
ncbi:methyl-accepting chemotaxis protein [Orrella sp. JC864]|uniref:methyl-accepting chemotaxis protein n=1 Tax=Orrella sp. JC864 TaxID=3120298 RepID=UPI0012BC37A1